MKDIRMFTLDKYNSDNYREAAFGVYLNKEADNYCFCFVADEIDQYPLEDLLEQYVSLKKADYAKFERKFKSLMKLDLIIIDDFLLHTLTDESETKMLFSILETRTQDQKSTIICSQRNPESWAAMIMNDEISANAIVKRVTKHYTIMINTK